MWSKESLIVAAILGADGSFAYVVDDVGMGTFATQDMEYSEQITEECVKRSKTCANTLNVAIQTLQPVGLPTQHEVSHLEALYPLLLDGQAVPTVDTI